MDGDFDVREVRGEVAVHDVGLGKGEDGFAGADTDAPGRRRLLL